jgi:acetyl esterase/lipase
MSRRDGYGKPVEETTVQRPVTDFVPSDGMVYLLRSKSPNNRPIALFEIGGGGLGPLVFPSAKAGQSWISAMGSGCGATEYRLVPKNFADVLELAQVNEWPTLWLPHRGTPTNYYSIEVAQIRASLGAEQGSQS